MGYHRAGFEVVGVDIRPQPNYPFDFVRADALETLDNGIYGHRFDAIHASPPCQAYANVTAWRGNPQDHPDLIGPTRRLLEQTGLPWVLENVRTAPIVGHIMVCGTMVGLRVRRHRHFETSWNGWTLPSPGKHRPDYSAFDHGGKQTETVYRDAMWCQWMTVHESREAIPPAYTELIGHQLAQHLKVRSN